MSETAFAILVGLTVAALGFGAWQVVARLVKGDRRRVKQRLATEGDESLVAMQSLTLRGVGAKPSRLAKWGPVKGIQTRLHQAFPDASVERFLAVAGILGVAGLMLGAASFGSLLMGLAGGLAGAGLPFWVVEHTRAQKVKRATEQLPEALDFMVRVLRAGHSLSGAIKMMGEELDRPLSEEFRRCYDQHSLGQPMEECLKDMAGRVRSTDFSFFVTAVLIQRQTGGDLSTVLTNIGSMVRQRVQLAGHVKAKTAEGRFTGYILVAFPVVLFGLSYFLNPKYAGTLVNTTTGQWLLGTAFALEVMGLFAIRRITTIKV